MKTVVTFLFALLTLSIVNLKAQEVVSTSGGYYSNAYGSYSFTIGEPVIETFQSPAKIITQGFQQTRLLIVTVEDAEQSQFSIEAFPNPTKNNVTIKVKNTPDIKLIWELTDLNGKVLNGDKTRAVEFTISLDRFDSGIYFLNLTFQQEEIKSLKIIKN